jgi:hypothetical protein
VRTLESLSSSTAPSRTLLFVISFVARALLSARGSLSSSRAARRTLRLVSSLEAMVTLFKMCSSFCYSAWFSLLLLPRPTHQTAYGSERLRSAVEHKMRVLPRRPASPFSATAERTLLPDHSRTEEARRTGAQSPTDPLIYRLLKPHLVMHRYNAHGYVAYLPSPRLFLLRVS